MLQSQWEQRKKPLFPEALYLDSRSLGSHFLKSPHLRTRTIKNGQETPVQLIKTWVFHPLESMTQSINGQLSLSPCHVRPHTRSALFCTGDSKAFVLKLESSLASPRRFLKFQLVDHTQTN